MAVTEKTSQDVRSEIRAWLAENWDPDLTVGEWWERLADGGWAVPTWPEEWHGRGLSRDEANIVGQEIAEAGAIGPPAGLGLMLAGPTIVAHGNDEQKRRYLRPIVTGREAWCQLFSEPGAGSDLASLQCKGERDGDEWIFNGQKVWTSGAQHADLGMLIARTNPDAPKHKGISYFALEMAQAGVEVRPLREMTGRALFNEVFLTDVRAHNDALIGDENEGWGVAMTTLANERVGLGAGGGAARSGAVPGTKTGHLERRAGDFAKGGGGAQMAMAARGGGMMLKLAKGLDKTGDPIIRQELMKLYTLDQIARYTTMRSKAAAKAGKRPGPEANTAKLMMSKITRMSRDIGLSMLGPGGTLIGKEAPLGGMIAEMALFSPAVSIYGGSDEVQKNIIGERVLGLPKEPNDDKITPFRDLKVGTQR